MLLPGLGGPTVSREQELRVALTARDMAEGGSWLIPHYLGEPRLRKPPLLYWLVAAADRLAGQTDEPSVTRLPTALAGIGLILALYLGGRRWIGPPAAAVAALAALTSQLFLRHAHLGETDIVQAFFSALAIFALAAATRRPRAWGAWLAAGLATGLSFMTKGVGGLLPPIVLAVYLALTPKAERPSGKSVAAGLLLAVLLAAAIVAPWYVWLYFGPMRDQALAAVQFEMSALGSETHHRGPLLYYVYTLPLTLLPWGLWLPSGLMETVRRARRHAGARWVAAWFVVTFAVLTLMPSKQQHYATQLLAPAALALGGFLRHALRRGADRRAQLARGYVTATWLVLLLFSLALTVAPFFLSNLPTLACAGLGGLALLAGVAAWRAPAGQPSARRRLPAIAAMMLALAPMTFGVVVPSRTDGLYPKFLRRVRAQVRAAPRLAAVGTHVNTVVYYAGRPVRRAATWEQAREMAGPDGWIVVTGKHGKGLFPPGAVAEDRLDNARIALYGPEPKD